MDLAAHLGGMAGGLVPVDDPLGGGPVDDRDRLPGKGFQLFGILFSEGLFKLFQSGSQGGANVSVADSFLFVLANPLFR